MPVNTDTHLPVASLADLDGVPVCSIVKREREQGPELSQDSVVQSDLQQVAERQEKAKPIKEGRKGGDTAAIYVEGKSRSLAGWFACMINRTCTQFTPVAQRGQGLKKPASCARCVSVWTGWRENEGVCAYVQRSSLAHTALSYAKTYMDLPPFCLMHAFGAGRLPCSRVQQKRIRPSIGPGRLKPPESKRERETTAARCARAQSHKRVHRASIEK